MTTLTDRPRQSSAAHRPEPAAPEKPRPGRLYDDRWPDRFALAMFAFAVLVVLVTVVPPWHRYFERSSDVVSSLTIPIVPGFTYAALLIAMAVALRRRLRAAWWLLLVWWLVIPEIARLVAMAADPQVALSVGFVFIAGVIVVAIRVRDQFSSRQVAGSVAAAVACFLVGGLVVLGVGALLVREFGTADSLPAAALHVFDSMLGDLGWVSDGPVITAPWWVRVVTGLVGAAVVLTSAHLLFRAPRTTHRLDAPDEARVRTLLRDFGGHDSLGYFATRRDKAVVWDTGDPATAIAGVSYRVVGSVSLASGNPLGDPNRWPAAIEAWRRLPVPAAGHSRSWVRAGTVRRRTRELV
jgi:lysyl-tRNA synthetase class 2